MKQESPRAVALRRIGSSQDPEQLIVFQEDGRPLCWVCDLCCKPIEELGLVEVISGGALGTYPYPHARSPHSVIPFHNNCFRAIEDQQLPISPGGEIDCNDLRTVGDAETVIHKLCEKAWFQPADERAFRRAIARARNTTCGRRTR